MSTRGPSSPRYIILDESNDRFDYSDRWTTSSTGFWSTNTDFGDPYGGTVAHARDTTQVSYSIEFEGSAGRISGALDLRSSQTPTWTCTIDNQPITIQNPSLLRALSSSSSTSNILTNVDLCAWGPGGDLTTPYPASASTPTPTVNITDGIHTLTVSFRTGLSRLAFDRFMYAPSSSASVGQPGNEGVMLELGVWDTGVEYSTGWRDLDGLGRVALGTAAVRVKFFGTGITWIGALTADQSRPGRAQWQLNGGEQNNFTLPTVTSLNRNRKIIEISNLERRHHTLIVTNLGSTSVSPLVLSRLWVFDGAFPEPPRTAGGNDDNAGAFSTTIDPIPSTTDQPIDSTSPSVKLVDPHADRKTPIGAIVGGVLGGLAIIFVAILALIWIRRKTRVRSLHVESRTMVTPGHDSRPSMQTRPSDAQNDLNKPAPDYDDNADAATLRTIVGSLKSEKWKRKKKDKVERKKLKPTNQLQADAMSIMTEDAQSGMTHTYEKGDVRMVEVVQVPLVPNRLVPVRRQQQQQQDEPPAPRPLPRPMPAIPEQRPTTATSHNTDPSTHPTSPPSNDNSSTYSASNISTIAPLPLRPNRRPITGAPVPIPLPQPPIPIPQPQSSVNNTSAFKVNSNQRPRTPSPPPADIGTGTGMDRHTSVSTYSRPPSTVAHPSRYGGGRKSFWRSTRRTTAASDLTNWDGDRKHASVSTYAHPPSELGGGHGSSFSNSGMASGGLDLERNTKRDTDISISTFSGAHTLVDEPLQESSESYYDYRRREVERHPLPQMPAMASIPRVQPSDLESIPSSSNSHTLAPLRPMRRPAVGADVGVGSETSKSPVSPETVPTGGLSKQEEVAREAAAVASFTSRLRSRVRVTNSSGGDGVNRKKHKDAGVVLVPPVFEGSRSGGTVPVARTTESPGPPGYTLPRS